MHYSQILCVMLCTVHSTRHSTQPSSRGREHWAVPSPASPPPSLTQTRTAQRHGASPGPSLVSGAQLALSLVHTQAGLSLVSAEGILTSDWLPSADGLKLLHLAHTGHVVPETEHYINTRGH